MEIGLHLQDRETSGKKNLARGSGKYQQNFKVGQGKIKCERICDLIYIYIPIFRKKYFVLKKY